MTSEKRQDPPNGSPKQFPVELEFLIAQGLRVVPCKPGTKKPFESDWPNRASGEAKVIAAWGRKYRNANWGVVLPDDVIVLDADSPVGFKVVDETFGPFETLRIKSGGEHRGEHVYLRAPGHALRTGLTGLPGLELKARGACVIVPPSRVERAYEFLARTAIAPAPPDLLDFLAQGSNGRERSHRAPKVEGPIHDGSRDNTLISLAGSMRRRGMTETEIAAALFEVNRRCVPPVASRDVRRIAHSACRYEPGDAAGVPTWTDAANAERFVRQHAAELKYAAERGEWFSWTGTHWPQGDATGAPTERARQTARTIYAEAAGVASDDARRRLAAWAIQSESRSRLDAIVALARSFPEMRVDRYADVFDRHPDLLACANGVVDLRTGELGPHERDLMLTKLSPVAYRPDATCPAFDAFLNSAFENDAEMVAYVDRVLGYALTGHARERAFFLLLGDGRNGKTTLAGVMKLLLADAVRDVHGARVCSVGLGRDA